MLRELSDSVLDLIAHQMAPQDGDEKPTRLIAEGSCTKLLMHVTACL